MLKWNNVTMANLNLGLWCRNHACSFLKMTCLNICGEDSGAGAKVLKLAKSFALGNHFLDPRKHEIRRTFNGASLYSVANDGALNELKK